ncbi:sporulation protein YpjB [Halobacillus mangrovi]|uniref:sporulation protein YpjB n=1 Tax=Halobacillus mangrovi TaxID=402384 RepID=UPI003D96ADE5
MGRAILMILCSVLFALTPINHHGKMEVRASQEWDTFILQFQYLISDEKYELAERMLHNRLPQMEQYVETLSDEERSMWDILVEPLATNNSDDFNKDAARLVMFMNAVTDENPTLFTKQALIEISRDLQNVFIPVDDIAQQWDVLAPTVQVFYPGAEIEGITVSISSLNSNDTVEARDTAFLQLDDLIKNSKTPTLDALLWTILTIGGTIILTLSYVSIRKFKGHKAMVHSRKSENS